MRLQFDIDLTPGAVFIRVAALLGQKCLRLPVFLIMPHRSAQLPQGQETHALADERRAFERQRAQLLRRYKGQYVAVYEGRVVDHDPDDEALACRLFVKLGDVPFYIARVEERPTVYDLPSPEIED